MKLLERIYLHTFHLIHVTSNVRNLGTLCNIRISLQSTQILLVFPSPDDSPILVWKIAPHIRPRTIDPRFFPGRHLLLQF